MKRHATRNRKRPWRRLELERFEERIVPTVNVVSEYPGLNYGIANTLENGTASAPPDTQGAAGPNSFIETVNQSVSIDTPKNSGGNTVADSLADFYFTQGGLPHLSVGSGNMEFQSDPFVNFDPQIQRYVVGDIDVEVSGSGSPVTNGANALLLAVSKSANPTTLTSSDWFFYEISTAESGVALQDYPGNVGYNADALVITQDSFSTTARVHTLVNAISLNALINGSALTLGTNYFQTDLSSEILPRPATMFDSAPGAPMWMVAAPQGVGGTGSNNTVDIIEMSNVLSANPIFTTTTLSVNSYFTAVPMVQPNGTAIPTTKIDSRILNVDEQNGLLVASQTVSDSAGDLDNARWYEIDVSSGTPVLLQQGDVGGGPGIYDAYPGVGINSQGSIGISYMQAGKAAGQFLSVYVTGRTPSDPAGTMETPVLAQAGAQDYFQTTAKFGNPPAYRLGDMSGIYVDSDGTFWIANEYADSESGTAANWATAIANFSLGAPINILNFGAQEGVPLTNVPVATFIDNSGNSPDGDTVTISWGDGTTSAGTVVANSSGTNIFTILGSHTYTEEGNYTFTVSVNNGVATIGPVSARITVADAPLSGSAQVLNGSVGTFLTNALVGIFSDSDTTNTVADPQGDVSDYTATVRMDEGNGLSVTTAAQIVNLSGNTYAVYANFPFSFVSGGLFAATVTIRDVGGATVVINSSVSVASNPAIPPLVPFSQTDTAGPFSGGFVALEDALTNLLMSERLFMIAVAFGTPAQQQSGFSNLTNAYFGYEAAVLHYDLSLPGS
jgi:hypothetical protein